MSPGGGADGKSGHEDDWDETDSGRAGVADSADAAAAESAAARRARLRRGRAPRESRLGNALRSGRVRLGIAAGVVAVIALGLVAWFTPVISVSTVRVTGLSTVPEQEVLTALQVPEGLSMLRLDTNAMAERVAALPKVRSARVQRVFPSSVEVTVDERVAVAYFDSPDGTHLLDRDSVEFAIEPPSPSLPKLVTEHPGGTDPVTEAAVAVIAAAPPDLRVLVERIIARSASDIALELRDGRTVLWGGVADSARKAAVVMPVLTQDGKVFDISSPNLVTVK
ncbi:cell division protein FtsQ/DivIB [Nocardia yamanashiensis]|uniref:cell division protein FtsQ/DivIB n=1 Tax=Nocardia yamanashiensis TaxID=209247 RepID=UPI000A042169